MARQVQAKHANHAAKKVRKAIKKSAPKRQKKTAPRSKTPTKAVQQAPQQAPQPVQQPVAAHQPAQTTPAKKVVKRTKTVQAVVHDAQKTQKSAGNRRLPKANRKGRKDTKRAKKAATAKGKK